MDGDSPCDAPLNEKRRALCAYIRSDMTAADLRWSLFVAAAQNYKFDSVLRPFPPQFQRDDVKDIERLRDVMTKMPALPTLLALLENPLTDCSSSDRDVLLDLLHWVLIEQDDPSFRTLSKDEVDKVLAEAPGEKVARPQFIFSVDHKRRRRFMELSKTRNTFWGYHGSRLENFYSILCHGLVSTLGKREVYGSGTYLASDYVTALMYSQSGSGWGGSLIGSGLSCMALCEIVEHPDVICEKPDAETSKEAEDSQLGNIPQNYILVKNSDLVQVRYLLVYGKNPHPIRSQKNADDSMMSWFSKHKLFTLMLGYVLLLSAVGISNSPTVMRYYRMLLRRWNH